MSNDKQKNESIQKRKVHDTITPSFSNNNNLEKSFRNASVVEDGNNNKEEYVICNSKSMDIDL